MSLSRKAICSLVAPLMAMSIMLPTSPANARQETTKQTIKIIKQVEKKKVKVKKNRRASRTTMRRVAQSYAIKTMHSKYKWGSKQFKCLNHIWENESHWQWDSKNKRSGALGIPQAYPGHKMKSAGKDYKTNYRTQINWGLNYIKKRYGTPCGAYHYRKRHGYY